MATHTPGPWAVRLDSRHEVWLITAEDGEVEVCQDRGWGSEYFSEDIANARLISAAPELLEVAQGLMELGKVGVINDVEWFGRIMQQARAATDKATGAA